jgi:hypothetical protein
VRVNVLEPLPGSDAQVLVDSPPFALHPVGPPVMVRCVAGHLFAHQLSRQ